MSAPDFTNVTIRTISPDGWPVDFELEPKPGATAEAILFLEDHGYQPAPVGSSSKSNDIQYTPDGLPVCPKHGAPMKKREKQGDTWYSHQVVDANGNECYCRGYASKSSPGWNID